MTHESANFYKGGCAKHQLSFPCPCCEIDRLNEVVLTERARADKKCTPENSDWCGKCGRGWTFISNVEADELRARAEKAEAAVAAYRVALEDWRAARELPHSDAAWVAVWDRARDSEKAALATDIGRGWVPPDVARQAVEALEAHVIAAQLQRNDEPFTIHDGDSYAHLVKNEQWRTSGNEILVALAALKKAVGE